jgi:leader peptidase (prepilin peptidase)/N-methyltransferase
LSEVIWGAVLFLYGTIFGSFYNVVIYRLPRQQSIVHPRSRCPNCQRHLTPGELVPLYSFIAQRGKCRGCGAPISIRYPLVELATGLGFAAVGFVSSGVLALLGGLIFFSLLVIIALIDLEHKLIPNILSIPGIIAGLLLSCLGWGVPWTQSLLGTAVGGGVMLAIALISRGGMGMGDVKLLALIGAFLGPWQTLLVLFWASVLGSVGGLIYLYLTKQGRKTPIPFGPALAAAAFAVYLWSLTVS